MTDPMQYGRISCHDMSTSASKWSPKLPWTEGTYHVHDTMLGLTFLIKVEHREHGLSFMPQVLHLTRWYSMIAAPTWWEYKVVSHDIQADATQLSLPFGGE